MLCSPLREMEILEIFVDAAWEAVRDDNPSEENYERQLYLNNAAVDFERGTIRTNQRLERGQPGYWKQKLGPTIERVKADQAEQLERRGARKTSAATRAYLSESEKSQLCSST